MQSIRNFIITFFISLIVFALIAWLILGKLTPEDDIEENVPTISIPGGEKNEENKIEEAVENDSFTALLCCYDDSLARADAIVLINVNKEHKKYAICSIPSYLKLDTGTASVKNEVYLGDLVVEKDRSYFLEKVEALTGLPVDYYAFMSTNEFVKIIDEIGGIEYNIPSNMYYKDVDGKVLVDLKAGLTRLNGEKALELVRFRGYKNADGIMDDGDRQRRETQCNLVYTIFESFLKESNRQNIDDIVDNVLKLIVSGNTNFTATAFIRHKDMILGFENYSHNIIQYPVSTTKMQTLETGEQIAIHTPNIREAVENTFKEYRTVRD